MENTRRFVLFTFLFVRIAGAEMSVPSQSNPSTDWLVTPALFKAQIVESKAEHALTLENGLVRRVLRLAPNAATVDYRNLVSGEQLLRATGPEAKVTLDGVEYAVGGLEGQPCQNFLKAAWLESLRPTPNAYRFSGWKAEPLTARFPWKKRPEWLAKDYPWPAPGKAVTLTFLPPAGASAKLSGKVLFEETFLPKLDASWKTQASALNPRSSFCNEGKAGEIYTPPETAVYAERAWPQEAVTAEVTVDAGDDTTSNAWGPGLALVTPKGTLSFIFRPNQTRCDINGEPLGPLFDRAKSVTLRLRLEGKTAHCEASQDGKSFVTIGSAPCPAAPTALRVGKVGRRGEGKDDPVWAEKSKDTLVRCHVTRVALFGPEPEGGGEAPARKDLPEIQVHYAIYDGIPLVEKWLTVRNTASKPVRVDRTLVESLKIMENESSTEPNPRWESPSLYVETDYAFMNMTGKGANQHSVHFKNDPSYGTQINYECQTPALLEVAPEFGPGVELAPGAELTSIRAFELFRDSHERERRGLAQRRMYRVIAPWTQENPVMVHLISNNPEAIRKIIDQASEVGVEMIILSFGSGMNMENADPAYQAKYKEVADYARGKGIVIGAYSLLASRGAGTKADNCQGPGNRVRYGVMPCLGSTWGAAYLQQLKNFMSNTGFAILEHDGSYPGDTCAATDHPHHKGLADSQWVQFRAIADLYTWCRANAIYLNIPDWYYLNGGSKCAMNYKENNWSLPRAEQEIIERQNIFDGTWEKTSSMGWMFVPLTQYHGGGAAATIEPLCEHLDHYEARLSNLFGAGVQACYRGPRIYDTDDTKALVKKWVSFYKAHREVLDADIIHLRRPDGRDWDGILHVNPQGQEKALAFIYNPLEEPIERTLTFPLYYAGLSERALVSVNGGAATSQKLARDYSVTLNVTVPAKGRTWLLFKAP